VRQVASDYPGVEVRDADILNDADRTATFGVFTTPFIVVDGQLAFVGVPREADLRTLLEQSID
jgi:hypothetical protein